MNDEKWVKDEIEQIIIYLDRIDHFYKAKMMSKLYTAYINKIIDEHMYLHMLSIIDNWQRYDEDVLLSFYDEHLKGTINMVDSGRDYVVLSNAISISRLTALGLIIIKYELVDLTKYNFDDEDEDEDMMDYEINEKYELTAFGVILSEIIKIGSIKTKYEGNSAWIFKSF